MSELTIKVAEEVRSRFKTKVDYKVGTMIELPRACITSDEIAAQADFYSFGTNDLTQTTYGLSRDDAGKIPSFLHRSQRSSLMIPLYLSIRKELVLS